MSELPYFTKQTERSRSLDVENLLVKQVVMYLNFELSGWKYNIDIKNM